MDLRALFPSLSLDDALGVVDVLLDTVGADRFQDQVRDGLRSAIRQWTGADWVAVAVRLREPERDSGKIADWLDGEIQRERERQARIGG